MVGEILLVAKKKRVLAEPTFRIVEKRSWMKEASGGTASDASGDEEVVRYPTYVEQLQAELAAKGRRVEAYLEKMKQENERYKERLSRGWEQRWQQEKIKLLTEILSIADNLEQAIVSAEAKASVDSLLEGIKLVHNLLQRLLAQQGIEHIETVAREFDPKTQEAVQVVTVNDPCQNNIVITEIVKGYKLNERVIRPAKVRVGKLG